VRNTGKRVQGLARWAVLIAWLAIFIGSIWGVVRLGDAARSVVRHWTGWPIWLCVAVGVPLGLTIGCAGYVFVLHFLFTGLPLPRRTRKHAG
jgi:hypothetical protein